MSKVRIKNGIKKIFMKFRKYCTFRSKDIFWITHFVPTMCDLVMQECTVLP